MTVIDLVRPFDKNKDKMSGEKLMTNKNETDKFTRKTGRQKNLVKVLNKDGNSELFKQLQTHNK